MSDGQSAEAETARSKTASYDRHGLPGLTDREKNLADSDAALLLKQVIKLKNRKVYFLTFYFLTF